MNEEICALDHVDNIDGLIARSGANLNSATHELLSDQRTIGEMAMNITQHNLM